MFSFTNLYFGYDQSLGPEHIDVIWPDGQKSVILENLDERNITISREEIETVSTP